MNATRSKFSPEFRDRAVRMVAEHCGDYPSQWAAMTSIAGKVGCTTETLRRWCREDAGRRRKLPATGSGSRLWNARSRSFAVPTRSCARLRRSSHHSNRWRDGRHFAQAELDRHGKW